jgi:hypothetical protein
MVLSIVLSPVQSRIPPPSITLKTVTAGEASSTIAPLPVTVKAFLFSA